MKQWQWDRNRKIKRQKDFIVHGRVNHTGSSRNLQEHRRAHKNIIMLKGDNNQEILDNFIESLKNKL